MSFKFHCTNCGQKIEAEAEHIGQNVSCPSCSQLMLVPTPSDTSDHTPPPLEVVNWHYELDGQPTGPVTEHEIKGQVAAGKITASTRVWTKGMTGWVNAGETSLRGLFSPASSQTAATDQIKSAARNLYTEGKKVTDDVVGKSTPFIKTHVIPRLKTPRYIILLISGLTYFYQGLRISGLQDQAAPIIAALNQRHDLKTVGWKLIGSLVSVVSGENITAIRNALDQLFGDNPLNARLAPIIQEIHDASFWQNCALWGVIISSGWIIFKYWRQKRKLSARN